MITHSVRTAPLLKLFVLELDIEWSGEHRKRLVERWVNEIVR